MNTTVPIKLSIAVFFAAFASTLFAAEEPKPSLCKPEELPIFIFKIKNKQKLMSICAGNNEEYLTYRFGTPDKIELQYPEKLDKNSWKLFEFHGYSRGGGIENDAMGDYTLSFTNNGINYTVSQGWRLAGNDYSIGITISTPQKILGLKGDQNTQIGSLTRLEGKRELLGRE